MDAVQTYRYKSRSVKNAFATFLCGIAATVIGVFGFVAITEKLDAPTVFTSILALLFLIAFAFFPLGLISPFEQRLEITASSLRWISERAPKTSKEVPISEIESIIVHTLDSSPTKIVVELTSGKILRIPFGHVLCNEAEANSFVQILETKKPGIKASVK